MVSGTPLYNLDDGPKDLNGELVRWLFVIFCDRACNILENNLKSFARCMCIHQAFLRVLPFDQSVRVKWIGQGLLKWCFEMLFISCWHLSVFSWSPNQTRIHPYHTGFEWWVLGKANSGLGKFKTLLAVTIATGILRYFCRCRFRGENTIKIPFAFWAHYWIM